MNHYRYRIQVVMMFLAFSACNGQEAEKPSSSPQSKVQTGALVGGGCDGCELMYEGMPSRIDAVDTSAGWKEAGQRLLVKGKVVQPDGRTPAAGVILYYWQTDNTGRYSPAGDVPPKAMRHGHIRGWVKTDSAGSFEIYTIRPAPYPNDEIPAHIHFSIKEPAIDTEYYIDDLVFDDDSLLDRSKRNALENRGGSGIVTVQMNTGLQLATRTIILGLNIPSYPRR